MLGVDTNVLVRFLTHDDEKQFKAARSLMGTEILYLPDSVVLETEWVLRDVYAYSRQQILDAFQHLFGLKNIVLADPLKMAQVLEWHESGLDFADALHLAKSAHLSELKTFDKDFIRDAKGKSECRVSHP